MELSTLLLGILTLCICVYYLVIGKLSHFAQLKIPYVQPVPLLGNLTPFLFQRMALVHLLQKMYNLFSNAKYFGFYDFMTPIYVIRDPELINTIAIKNFDNFMDHRNFANDDLEPIASKNLFGLKGDHWREMRKLLSPSFTSSKMKMMFHLMCQCAENFTDYIVRESGKSGKTYEMKTLTGRYATDVVASCAFGISVDSVNQPNNEFYILAKKAMILDFKKSMKIILFRNAPKLAKFLRIKAFSSDVEDFFKNIVIETVKIRDEQGIVRPDMIQLMMETRDKNRGPTFDIDEIIAQAFVFFLAGFDTTSTTACFVAHEIAINPDVQNKVRNEIENVLKQTNGKPTYEAINGMKYLDAVIIETMRLYPVVAYLERVCTKHFEMPPATADGKSFTIKPGESVWFPIYDFHHDPKYYPEPDKFNPNRFLNSSVDNSIYFPFGYGPRICIAYRFALMETKIMLFSLLSRCDFKPDVKTKIPLVLDKKTIFNTAEGGFWLKLCTRESPASIASCLSNDTTNT